MAENALEVMLVVTGVMELVSVGYVSGRDGDGSLRSAAATTKFSVMLLLLLLD